MTHFWVYSKLLQNKEERESTQLMDLQFDDFTDEMPHPLDSVEEVLNAHNWTFDRMNNDELVVQVAGKACGYRLFFIWQDELNAIQFCCQYDIKISDQNASKAAATLRSINEDLWMGHFDIPKSTNAPTFRYTSLLRGMSGSNADAIDDLVSISLSQCERYYAAFHLLANNHVANDQNLSLALISTVGEG